MNGAVPVFKKNKLTLLPVFIRSFFLVIFMFSFSMDLIAQTPKSFTRDEVKFLEEMESFLEELLNKINGYLN